MTLKRFLKAHVFSAPGHRIEFSLLHAMFRSATDDKTSLSHRVKFSRAIHAAGLRTGVGNHNRVHVINASLNPLAQPALPLKLRTSKTKSRKRIKSSPR
jgi:hypothetical protein